MTSFEDVEIIGVAIPYAIGCASCGHLVRHRGIAPTICPSCGKRTTLPVMATHLQLAAVCRDMEAYKNGPSSVDLYGHDCSSGCRKFHKLDGNEGMDWGVCTEPRSPRAGLLTFEHMGCEFFEPSPEESSEDDGLEGFSFSGGGPLPEIFIVKVTMTSPTRCVTATEDGSFRYEGGVNADMIQTMKERHHAYFKASMGPDGLEIAEELSDQGW